MLIIAPRKTTMAAGGMSKEGYIKMRGITPKVETALGEVVDLLVRPADPVGLSAAIDKIFQEYFVRLRTLDWTEKVYFTERIRDPFVRHFSWAIPYSKTLAALALRLKEYSRILEVGAGTGLWAHLLKELHEIPVVATDQSDGDYRQGWVQHRQHRYCSVEVIDAVSAIEKYNPEVLIMIWAPFSHPDYSTEPPMATNSLKAFKGNILVWIGEPPGGCTADDSFFEELHSNWEVIDEIGIPSWHQFNDDCTIWKRNSVSTDGASGGAGGGAAAEGAAAEGAAAEGAAAEGAAAEGAAAEGAAAETT